MKIYEGVNSLPAQLPKAVLTIGNFDGVHVGHQEVLNHLTARAAEIDGTSVVMTFMPHPRTYFHPDMPQKQITPIAQRLELLKEAGVDVVIVQPFDREFAHLKPEAFIKELLVAKIGVKELHVSNKFRFGCNAAGDIALLESLAEETGYQLHLVENLAFRHTIVASTFIRQAIIDGEMEIVRQMLGRPYSISGPVYSDTQRGSSLLNTPTCNIKPVNDLIPAFGIYACIAKLPDNQRHVAATYIGTRPTFQGVNAVFETHLLGYSGNLYGEEIQVELYKKTRDDKKFEHLHELMQQIQDDVTDVKRYFTRHIDDDYMHGVIGVE